MDFRLQPKIWPRHPKVMVRLTAISHTTLLVSRIIVSMAEQILVVRQYREMQKRTITMNKMYSRMK